MGKRLVLLGGGHAHMTVMHDIPDFIARGHTVIVVSPSSYSYYSGMGPGMLGGTYAPENIRFYIKEQILERGGRFIRDKAVHIDAEKRIVRLASGDMVSYDLLSCNTGSYVPAKLLTGQRKDIFFVKPISNLVRGRKRLKELLLSRDIRVGVIGGGPAGIEIAGNVWRLAEKMGLGKVTIQLFAGERLLGSQPEKVRFFVRKSLVSRGVEIIEQGYVQKVLPGSITLEDGSAWDQDIIFVASGIKPSPLFIDSGLPVGEDSGLLVDEMLRCVEHPTIFGGGDCISFAPSPLDKVGVYAVRENPILRHNLMAALEGTGMVPFTPEKKYLLIYNMGNGKGIFWKNGWIFHGAWAFLLKDYIDRKFIRKFIK